MSKLLSMGKAMAIIVDVYSKDRDGKPLEMKNGGTYRKFKLSVSDSHGNCGYIFEPIFGGDKKKIKAMVDSIGDEILIKKFNNGTLVDEELFGHEIMCVVGIKEPKESSGYDAQNVIDCYLKPTFGRAANRLLSGAAVAGLAPMPNAEAEQEVEDDIPF